MIFGLPILGFLCSYNSINIALELKLKMDNKRQNFVLFLVLPLILGIGGGFYAFSFIGRTPFRFWIFLTIFPIFFGMLISIVGYYIQKTRPIESGMDYYDMLIEEELRNLKLKKK
jgi:hypothetical protein